MTNRSLILMVIISLVLIFASLYIMKTISIVDKPGPSKGVINNIENPLLINKDFSLRFTSGQEFTFTDLTKHYTLLYFGFSHCPDICPMVLKNMDNIIDGLGRFDSLKVQAIFVSLDPSRDDLTTLEKFTYEHGGTKIKAATGSEVELKKITESLKVYHAKVEHNLITPDASKDDKQLSNEKVNSDDYFIDHTSFIYFVDSQGKLISQFAPNANLEDIIKDIKFHLNSK